MKKIELLFTLTLCASALNGMEPEKPNYMGMLPKELKPLIASKLTQSNTLEEAVNAIRSLTETNKEFNTIINNPITTRTIIRFLVQKFNAPSEYIAMKLSTLASQAYINLYFGLRMALYTKNFALAENLINAGADIDYQEVDVYPMLCTQSNVLNLLSILNSALAAQASLADTKQSLLGLEKAIATQSTLTTAQEENIESHLERIESHKELLKNIIPEIHVVAQENKDIFKNDEQFNDFEAAIDKENFKKAFAIIEPKTIMSHAPTSYYYAIKEPNAGLSPESICMVGANLSFVMYAIAGNQLDLLEWLLKHKANLELTMGTGNTAFTMAIKLGKKEIIELLVKNGANVNQQNLLKLNEKIREKINEYDITPIQGFINRTHTLLDADTLTLIMKNLALSKNTPLIYLLYSEGLTDQEVYDLVKLLLDSGANPNMTNSYGDTPLIVSTFMEGEGFANIMKLLLSYGADPLIKDNEGLTALDHMRSEDAENDPYREAKIKLLENAMKKEQKK